MSEVPPTSTSQTKGLIAGVVILAIVAAVFVAAFVLVYLVFVPPITKFKITDGSYTIRPVTSSGTLTFCGGCYGTSCNIGVAAAGTFTVQLSTSTVTEGAFRVFGDYESSGFFWKTQRFSESDQRLIICSSATAPTDFSGDFQFDIIRKLSDTSAIVSIRQGFFAQLCTQNCKFNPNVVFPAITVDASSASSPEAQFIMTREVSP